MKTITTKEELVKAFNAGGKVKVVGPLAVEVAKEYKKTKKTFREKVVEILAGPIVLVDPCPFPVPEGDGPVLTAFGINKNCKVKIGTKGGETYAIVEAVEY